VSSPTSVHRLPTGATAVSTGRGPPPRSPARPSPSTRSSCSSCAAGGGVTTPPASHHRTTTDPSSSATVPGLGVPQSGTRKPPSKTPHRQQPPTMRGALQARHSSALPLSVTTVSYPGSASRGCASAPR
jgi:hypothetical protein